jgi:hypothetical protein
LCGTHGLVIPVDAAHPAAWAAFAFVHFVFHHYDMFGSSLGLGAGDGPADPLIPRQRRDVFPYGQHLFVGQNSLPHILRKFVHGAIGKCFRKHTFILAQSAKELKPCTM